MARQRGGILQSIISGASTWFSQFAQFFRYRPGGGASSGQQMEPGRPIVDPAQLVAAAESVGLSPLPSGPSQWSRSYICIVTSTETGEVVARIRTEMQFTEGAAYQTTAAAARRSALDEFRSNAALTDLFVNPQDARTMPVKISCRRIGGTLKEVPQI